MWNPRSASPPALLNVCTKIPFGAPARPTTVISPGAEVPEVPDSPIVPINAQPVMEARPNLTSYVPVARRVEVKLMALGKLRALVPSALTTINLTCAVGGMPAAVPATLFGPMVEASLGKLLGFRSPDAAWATAHVDSTSDRIAAPTNSFLNANPLLSGARRRVSNAQMNYR